MNIICIYRSFIAEGHRSATFLAPASFFLKRDLVSLADCQSTHEYDFFITRPAIKTTQPLTGCWVTRSFVPFILFFQDPPPSTLSSSLLSHCRPPVAIRLQSTPPPVHLPFWSVDVPPIRRSVNCDLSIGIPLSLANCRFAGEHELCLLLKSDPIFDRSSGYSFVPPVHPILSIRSPLVSLLVSPSSMVIRLAHLSTFPATLLIG